MGLLRHWRTHGLTTDVALITAADDEPSIRLALAHGAFDYLIKPFTVSRLHELLPRRRTRRNVANARHDQSSLDRLIGILPSAPEAMPRGIDPHTLERVAQALTEHPTAISAEDIGGQVGLSRVTA